MDQMQADTDAGFAAYVAEHAEEFAILLATR